MANIDKIIELDRKQKEAFQQYDESKRKNGVGDPKFLNLAQKCLEERYKLLKLRANAFSEQLNSEYE